MVVLAEIEVVAGMECLWLSVAKFTTNEWFWTWTLLITKFKALSISLFFMNRLYLSVGQ